MTKTNSSSSHNSYSGVHLFNESGVKLPVDTDDATKIGRLIQQFDNVQFHFLEIVFVDADEILRINSEYLDHHYVTDVITFRYDEGTSRQAIEGTIYGCSNQIKEQAEKLNESSGDEFRRIIIHGLLHLAGYDDQSEADQNEMRERENFYLRKLANS